ncbi:DUF2637 domain-containing protein [Streptacidiphilus cavernicola]|uniref:DUF2637 domain-containing protein n=1 Tax=Streptacidiphilus cavernicola TaxID=3342716 RepID=A0ABV6W2U3_9ACTN
MADSHATGKPRTTKGIRVAWTLVLAMTLGLAAWSLTGRLHGWGMPTILAVPLSLTYDTSGLVAAAYARRAIERNTPAGLARFTILGFVACSAVLNWSEGKSLGGYPAAAALAALSCLVELLFELHRRDIRDGQRAARGLVAERLPHIPLLGWMLHPGRSWELLRGAVAQRLDQLDNRPAQPEPTEASPAPAPGRSPATLRAAVAAAQSTLPDAGPEEIAAALARVNIIIDPADAQALMVLTTANVRPLHGSSPTITDLVRIALDLGITDHGEIVDCVRQFHPAATEETITRTRRKIESGQVPVPARTTAPANP